MTRKTPAGKSPLAMPRWDIADPQAAQALRALIEATRRNIPADRTLSVSCKQGTAICFVVSGWLVLSKSTMEGHRQIIDILLPGDVFDPRSAGGEHATADLWALTDVTLSSIPRGDWQRLLGAHADAHWLVDDLFALRDARMAERMLRLGRSNADCRIAYALLELGLRTSTSGLVGEKQFHIPMTQQVLGDFVGLSSVHVCRTFRRFERQNILSVSDHMDIVVHDLDALAVIAEIDLEELRREVTHAA
ncbi:Crp/Fnr family transcriptional regulator [Rhodosalinus sp. FB01]|uniref:Crp/Fnr family transcriptional regulator n=1 Tax=Rhodosalinus sp. FB01 TaxID=3239194 RepID=UPI00352608F1